jgi:hypothetical protein
MKKKGFNEGKACDAVVRWIEQREGSSRVQVSFPEAEGHPAPVELTCVIGNHRFAFEHTGIEPFEGQIELEVKANFAPLRQRFSTIIPRGEYWELKVPVHAMTRLKQRCHSPAISKLFDWISSEAPMLELAPLGRYGQSATRQADVIVPFDVILSRNSLPSVPGFLSVVHLVPTLDQSRDLRIERACEKKFGKLAAWKAQSTKTVLVFEENDDQLTNAIGVTESLIRVEATRPDKPDEIYLVTTSHSPWYIWRLRCGDRYFSDFTTESERGWEVDPAVLVSLTNR